MTSCRGMGGAIDKSASQDQSASVNEVLKFCMTYGICPKDLRAIRDMSTNNTAPSNYAEICKAYNSLHSGAIMLIDELINLMTIENLEIRLGQIDERSTIGFRPAKALKKKDIRK